MESATLVEDELGFCVDGFGHEEKCEATTETLLRGSTVSCEGGILDVGEIWLAVGVCCGEVMLVDLISELLW